MAKRATRNRKTKHSGREFEGNVGPAPKTDAAEIGEGGLSIEENPSTEDQPLIAREILRRGMHPQALDRILHPCADPVQIHPQSVTDE